MPSDLLMRIHGPEFRAMSERVLEATALTSRLNVLPFDDEDGKARLLEQILGRPLPPRTTIYPPFFTDHGLHLDLGERVFVNQNCTFLDYAGIRLADRVLVAPRARSSPSGTPSTPTTARSGSPAARSTSTRTCGSARARPSCPA
jgi:acetyltransferase-like isoleucine patch superfamily enzyme